MSGGNDRTFGGAYINYANRIQADLNYQRDN